MTARYRNEELERLLENWRRYMTGEYRNPLDIKIASIYRDIRESRASYRTSVEPMILGEFRDVDAAINALSKELQAAIRAELLEANATQRQKAWHCGLRWVRGYQARVDAAKRAIQATLEAQRARRDREAMRLRRIAAAGD